MKTSANVRRAEPTPRREQDGETYSAATRSRSTSTQPIAASSTATHTSCSRTARAPPFGLFPRHRRYSQRQNGTTPYTRECILVSSLGTPNLHKVVTTWH